MPMDIKRYPQNWIEISHQIRFVRAEGKCECTGECGRHDGRCNAEHGKPHPVTGSKVFLTTATWAPTPATSTTNKTAALRT